jgi:hypothetical protein
MLKNGAKAKEMEWTGADEAFEGRTNVTKKELVDYLTDNQNLLFTDRTTAKGVMRGDTSGRRPVKPERHMLMAVSTMKSDIWKIVSIVAGNTALSLKALLIL